LIFPPENANRFLSSLSVLAQESLLAKATVVQVPQSTVLHASNMRPRFIHFITSGLATVVRTTVRGETSDVGMVGLEGLVGSLSLIGAANFELDSAMQLEGTAVRLPIGDMKYLFETSKEIRGRVLEFVQATSAISSYSLACDRLHQSKERLARLLLSAQDSSTRTTLDFTQDFLATMLGTRRSTVNLAAGALQKINLIEYSRGRLTILDRDRMEGVACDCYKSIKKVQSELYRLAV